MGLLFLFTVCTNNFNMKFPNSAHTVHIYILRVTQNKTAIILLYSINWFFRKYTTLSDLSRSPAPMARPRPQLRSLVHLGSRILYVTARNPFRSPPRMKKNLNNFIFMSLLNRLYPGICYEHFLLYDSEFILAPVFWLHTDEPLRDNRLTKLTFWRLMSTIIVITHR